MSPDPRVPMAPKTEACPDCGREHPHAVVSHDAEKAHGWRLDAAQSADALLALREALEAKSGAFHMAEFYAGSAETENGKSPHFGCDWSVCPAKTCAYDREVLADTEQAAQARVKEIKEAAELPWKRALKNLAERHEWEPGMGQCICYAHVEARALLGERERGGDSPSESGE